jgi:hypothetical protein
LARYRIGQAGPSDAAPKPPASILAILEGRAELPENERDSPDSFNANSTGAGPSSPGSAARTHASDTSSPAASVTSLPSLHSLTAATLLDFYRKKGHFPAPPGPYEEERLRLAHKYGLDAPIRRKAIDRICNLAKKYFKTSSVVISLFVLRLLSSAFSSLTTTSAGHSMIIKYLVLNEVGVVKNRVRMYRLDRSRCLLRSGAFLPHVHPSFPAH